jgi:DNA-binding MarR family transcriptional regulator
LANRFSISKAVPARRSDRELEGSAAVPDSVKEISLGDLPDQLGFQVRRVQLWVFREFTRKLARLDVTLAQYSVLTVVDANPGINQLAVASALAIERAGLGRLIERLEARSLLKRLPSIVDRRSYVLHLTSEGRKALARMQAIVYENEKRLAQKFSPGDAERLRQVLAAFRDDKC